MKIYENLVEKEDGKRELYIGFTVHKATIYHTYIPLTNARCANLRIAKAKEAAIEEFLNRFEGQEYSKKEVLKAYAKIDPYFKDLYKELYPHGGSRSGAGRASGTIKNTGRTERFTQAITLDEKKYLVRCLEEYRKLKK